MNKRLTKYKKNKLSKTQKIVISFVLIILTIGIGYSALITNLSISGNILVKEYDDPDLFNKIANLSKKTDSCIYKYTGDVTDEVGVTTEATRVYFNRCVDKRNIIFNNICWQMIRTTETGGIKMIYNGEPDENGQCLSTRENNIGYAKRITQSMDTTYYYGTDYTYDKDSALFSLAGDITSGDIKIGEYTCKSVEQNGTCSILYYLDALSYGTTYYVLPINNSSHYSLFGELQYNQVTSSPAYVGYMFNTIYSNNSIDITTFKDMYQNIIPIEGSKYINVTNDATYPFAFNSTSKTYTSTMRQSNTNASISFNVAEAGDYLLSYDISSEEDCDIAYFYKDGVEIKRDSGIKSHQIIELNGLTPSNLIEVKYTKDPYTNSGSDSVTFSIGPPDGDPVDERYLFGNSFSYENGNYTLVDTIRGDRTVDVTNNHYTCFNSNGICSTLSYIFFLDSKAYYIRLTNGKGVEDALNEMLYNDDVNTTNSVLKTGIDAWYKKYLSNKTSMIEDAIYCNSREISNSNVTGWSPNGGQPISLNFKNYVLNTDLSCSKITDQFAVGNNKAKLTYPIGPASEEEVYILTNNNTQEYFPLTKTGETYWLISPLWADKRYVSMRAVANNGLVDVKGSLGQNANGVRPVISLKNGTIISSGDGSESNPWIVQE